MTGQQPQLPAGPFDGLSDEEVLAKAAAAFGKVLGYPIGSVQRSVAWAVYDSAAGELEQRLGRHVAALPLAVQAEAARRGERP